MQRCPEGFNYGVKGLKLPIVVVPILQTLKCEVETSFIFSFKCDHFVLIRIALSVMHPLNLVARLLLAVAIVRNLALILCVFVVITTRSAFVCLYRVIKTSLCT
jgi:hypothetical protein